MCQKDNKVICQHPEKLKGKPGECTSEQVRECHGDISKHACTEK